VSVEYDNDSNEGVDVEEFTSNNFYIDEAEEINKTQSLSIDTT
jgi:hypothetical protein